MKVIRKIALKNASRELAALRFTSKTAFVYKYSDKSMVSPTNHYLQIAHLQIAHLQIAHLQHLRHIQIAHLQQLLQLQHLLLADLKLRKADLKLGKADLKLRNTNLKLDQALLLFPLLI